MNVQKQLSISGGGSAGSFSCGLLQSFDNLDFDIVCGISTGSLISSHAFLNTKEDIKHISNVYTNVNTPDICKLKSPYELLFSESKSLYSTEPLRNLIESIATKEFIERVGLENEKGRKLYVGTYNNETKKFHAWDMTNLASSSDPGKVKKYCDILLASCSVPIIFPAVKIDGHYHSDAGTVCTAFVIYDFNDSKNKNKLATIIVNGYRGLYRTNTGRTILSIDSNVVKESPEQHHIPISVENADLSVYRMKFKIIDVPYSYRINHSVLDFNQYEMRRLHEFGRKLGESMNQ